MNAGKRAIFFATQIVGGLFLVICTIICFVNLDSPDMGLGVFILGLAVGGGIMFIGKVISSMLPREYDTSDPWIPISENDYQEAIQYHSTHNGVWPDCAPDSPENDVYAICDEYLQENDNKEYPSYEEVVSIYQQVLTAEAAYVVDAMDANQDNAVAQQIFQQQMVQQMQQQAVNDAIRGATPFEMGGMDMTQGNSFNNPPSGMGM